MTAIAVIVAMGVAGGLPAGVAGLLAATIVQPGLVLTAAVVHATHTRLTKAVRQDESALLAAVAGELRAGRSLRHALAGPGATSAGHPLRPVARWAALGVPFADLEPLLAEALPASASLVIPAIGMLEASGGNAAAVFELLAESHAIQRNIEDEQRAALAPARMSAVVLLALAAAAMAWLLFSGRMAALLSDGTGRALAGIGLCFITSGVVVFVTMLRRGATG